MSIKSSGNIIQKIIEKFIVSCAVCLLQFPYSGCILRVQNKTQEENKMTIEEMWEELENMGVSEQTLQIVTDINGYNEETMHDILYAYSGEREFYEE